MTGYNTIHNIQQDTMLDASRGKNRICIDVLVVDLLNSNASNIESLIIWNFVIGNISMTTMGPNR